MGEISRQLRELTDQYPSDEREAGYQWAKIRIIPECTSAAKQGKSVWCYEDKDNRSDHWLDGVKDFCKDSDIEIQIRKYTYSDIPTEILINW